MDEEKMTFVGGFEDGRKIRVPAGSKLVERRQRAYEQTPDSARDISPTTLFRHVACVYRRLEIHVEGEVLSFMAEESLTDAQAIRMLIDRY